MLDDIFVQVAFCYQMLKQKNEGIEAMKQSHQVQWGANGGHRFGEG